MHRLKKSTQIEVELKSIVQMGHYINLVFFPL